MLECIKSKAIPEGVVTAIPLGIQQRWLESQLLYLAKDQYTPLSSSVQIYRNDNS